MNSPRIRVASSIQEARENSFERIMNDATKAKQRNLNVTMRDKFMPGDEVPCPNMGMGMEGSHERSY